jgi:hypothetical protein
MVAVAIRRRDLVEPGLPGPTTGRLFAVCHHDEVRRKARGSQRNALEVDGRGGRDSGVVHGARGMARECKGLGSQQQQLGASCSTTPINGYFRLKAGLSLEDRSPDRISRGF